MFKFKKIRPLNSGFTLVELLVVIGIIAILSGVVVSNFVGARMQARDTQRKNDIRQIQIALEACRSVDSAGYPSAIECGKKIECNGTTYLAKVPAEPLNPCGSGEQYTYNPICANGTCTSYSLKACLENPNDGDGVTDALCSSEISYTVSSP